MQVSIQNAFLTARALSPKPLRGVLCHRTPTEDRTSGGTFPQHHAQDRIVDGYLLTVNSCIKVRLDLQADKSLVVVKGPFFP
jgi:hypothetical protein